MNYLEVVPKEKKSSIISVELKTLVELHGKVTPQMVVDSAKSQKSQLHGCFEWDDSQAARKYRLAQATAMILSQKFVCELKEKKQSKLNGKKIYVRKLLPEYDNERNFRNRIEALDNDENRKIIIERKISVLRSWCNGVVDIDELQGMRQKILSMV